MAGSAVSGTESALLAPNARLDQSYPSRTRTCPAAGWAPDSANEWVAETFTAGVSGSLTDVVLWVAGNTPESQVAVTPVDASGRPVVATPLATSTLGGSSTTTIGEHGVAFPTPARVEAEKQYAVVLFAPVREAWVWGADFGSAFADQIGTPCAVGTNPSGRVWLSGHFTRTLVALKVAKFGRGVVTSLPPGINCGRACRVGTTMSAVARVPVTGTF